MTKITWLGEDELHGGGAGPSFTTAYGGIKFPKGEQVEVSDPDSIRRARGNLHFRVEEPQAENDLSGMKIADLRALAESKDIDHEGMSKSELRAALGDENV